MSNLETIYSHKRFRTYVTGFIGARYFLLLLLLLILLKIKQISIRRRLLKSQFATQQVFYI